MAAYKVQPVFPNVEDEELPSVSHSSIHLTPESEEAQETEERTVWSSGNTLAMGLGSV